MKMPNPKELQRKAIEYYRWRRPDADVSSDQAAWCYYEVDTVADIVLRMVDVFADGHIERDSVALEERKGDACPSLVEGPFMEFVDKIQLDVVLSADFDALWECGTDTPFWFPDGFPKLVEM